MVVDRIEGGDIDSFATELFTDWGIGKGGQRQRCALPRGHGRPQGCDTHRLRGRGRSARHNSGAHHTQFNQYFKGGDTDGGVADAVGNLSYLLTTPGATEELMSKYANDRRRGGEETIDFFGIWIKISMFIAALMLIFFIITLVSTRRQNRYQRYIRLQQLQLPALIISFATIGMGLVVFVPLMIIMRRLRTASRKCPNCSTKMKRLDEKSDNAYLTPAQDTEERIDSVDYDVWLCPNCGETDILPYVNHSKNYTPCPNCGARACTLVADRIVKSPTTREGGLGTEDIQLPQLPQRQCPQLHYPESRPSGSNRSPDWWPRRWIRWRRLRRRLVWRRLNRWRRSIGRMVTPHTFYMDCKS